MSDTLIAELFGEDAAHEAFLVPFVKRLAVEEGTLLEPRVRSAVGGHARALHELNLFQKLVLSGRSRMPDLIVVCIDANCSKYDRARKDVADCLDSSLFDRVVIACPDPHVERWYMADPESFASVVGAQPPVAKRKCKRDVYKSALANTICQAGLLAPLGGIEFAPELVASMDLYRAGRNDKSLKGFTDDLRRVLLRLMSSSAKP